MVDVEGPWDPKQSAPDLLKQVKGLGSQHRSSIGLEQSSRKGMYVGSSPTGAKLGQECVFNACIKQAESGARRDFSGLSGASRCILTLKGGRSGHRERPQGVMLYCLS